MRPVIESRALEVASSAGSLWPLVTDTDRFNRVLGTTPIEVKPLERSDSGARFLVKTRTAGFALEYEELPFEWRQDRAFSVLRKMHGGPIESYKMAWELEPLTAGTQVRMRLEIVPRAWPFEPIARIQARRVLDRASRIVEGLDASLRNQAPSPYREPVTPVDEVRLRPGLEALLRGQVPAAIVERIETLLRAAPDADLVRLRPFALADLWGEDRRQVLRGLLHGVTGGLFELRWSVICPSCLGPSQQHESLRDLDAHGWCQLCDVSFELDLDRAVEATFFPHPSVRPSSDQMFCIGGPSRMPHVLAQVLLPPREPRSLSSPSEPGRYRVFARGGSTVSVEVGPEGAPSGEIVIDATTVAPGALQVQAGSPLTLVNATETALHVKLERLGFSSSAATAHLVSTLDEFRALFSADTLKRTTPLKVSRVAILFSDLTGSTALYSSVGDAAAFRLVDDHFDLMRDAVAKHEGVLVKTMGDAVLAAFTDPRACIQAALDALARFEAFRAQHPHGGGVGLKLGLHAGTCYVVTANGQLDYFGQTVNVASRIQHLAESGELLLAAEYAEDLSPETRAAVMISEPFEARVKGVDASLHLVRMKLRTAASRDEARTRP